MSSTDGRNRLLHEALQRLIFICLMEHEREAFMKLEMDTTHRKVDPVSKKLLGTLCGKKGSRYKME